MNKRENIRTFFTNEISITDNEEDRINKTNKFLLFILTVASLLFVFSTSRYTEITYREKVISYIIIMLALAFYIICFLLKNLKNRLMFIYPIGSVLFVAFTQYFQGGMIDNTFVYFPIIVMSGLYTQTRPLLFTTIFAIIINTGIFVIDKNRYFPLLDGGQYLVFIISIATTGAIVWFVMKRDSYLLMRSNNSYNEQIQINKMIEEERANLENRVKERATQLKKAYDELKDAETNLIQHEKMASLGMISAGIAHEINNPIGAIKSNVDIYKKLLEKIRASQTIVKDDILMDYFMKFEQINSTNAIACERVSQIINSLRLFARSDENKFQKADINYALESTLILLNNKVKNRIEIKKELGQIPFVNCSIGQINQVFMNLLVNAIDAIENKGTIWIKTGFKKGKVIISIKDSGCGISKENIKKIFKSGFTTKEPGKGTGLGLAIIKNIIDKHKGDIKIETELNKGTEFIVELPQN